jgi:parallel beta-helix repeat protein
MVFIGSENGRVYAFGNAIRVPEDYNTIQEAINAAAPGATIWIAPGIYNEPLVINKTITLIGKIGSEPTFNGGGSGIAITIVSGGSGSIIAGITITSWDQGIVINGASGCKVYDNIMSLISQNGIALEGSTASNNQIYSNIFQQDTVAINLTALSTSNIVFNNIITSNGIGLDVESSGNVVCANMMTENQVAISIKNSNNNKFFHNDFVSNDVQLVIAASTGNVWDDGYPSGGNYWSGHTGPDMFSGPNQDQAGSDGIVDTSYTVATGSVDRYPLVHGAHDIGITSVTMSKTVVGKGCTLHVELRILNYGTYDENFPVAAYANTSTAVTQSIALTKGSYIIVTLTWNTSSFAYGNYTISAYAWPVPDEANTADNNFTYGLVSVTIMGDVNGDGTVNILDAIIVSNAFLATPGTSNWNPNADINDDNIVNILDAIILANHFLQHYP